jgi:hypothetical protein
MISPSFALLSGIVLFSSAVAAVTHNVTVGEGLSFVPPYINASSGDSVSFTFTSNFSATQSSFESPCSPQAGGLDTGFVFNEAGGSNGDLAIAQFNITDTAPVWVHCRQNAGTEDSHCGQGMVFAINPGPDGSNNSFAVFQAAARSVGAQINATASRPSNSTGSVSGGPPTSTSTSKPNGAISLNIDAAMLMAAFGTVVSLIA